jgi:acetyl esterase
MDSTAAGEDFEVMRFVGIAIVAALLCSLAHAQNPQPQGNLCVRAANTAQTQPEPLEIEGATAHVYKSINGADLRLHVFTPSSSSPAPRPAVVFFFGGAWMIGTVTQAAPEARYVASRGAVSILVDYRTFCRDHVNITDEIADAKSAVRWVRSHAGELGVDPHRIAVSGGSSGGHLALSTALFKELDEKTENGSVSSKPDLIVLFYPCVDETTEEELSYGADAIGTYGRDVSPLYHIRAGMPRTIIFQGTADTLYGENKTYCDEARTKGNACEFVEFAEAPHGFMLQSRWYKEALPRLDEFLRRQGYLAAAPRG